MADDINLPNLVSHLQVNLGNTNGLVADATRQGSSVGAAIGQSMQQTLRDAVDDIPDIELNADSTDLDRDLHRVRGELNELANQRIGVDISIEDALRRMEELEPHLERLQNSHPNINVRASVGGALADLADLRDAAREVDEVDPEIDVDIDTADLAALDRDLHRVRDSLGRVVGMIGSLAGIAAPFATAGVAVGALLPLVAGLVTTLANIAPAAGVGVSALLALKLATGTFKLAMTGVQEAVTAALDPSSAEAYAEALKKLSPEARSFVGVIREMQPALDKLRKAVQDRVFEGFDTELKNTAGSVLPSLKTALLDTAGTLNVMGKGVAAAARDLGESGVLGTALKGATAGLANLSRAPGQVVLALGQIGAAAAPAFERLTAAGGSALDRLSEKLATAFETGEMQKAIEQAIAIIKQLGRIAGNIFGGIGNLIQGVSTDGEGLFSTLEKISQAFQDVTASKEFQAGLKELAAVAGELADAALPILVEAFKTVGDIVKIIGPPIREIIDLVGDQLGEVMKLAAPIWREAAEAFKEFLPVLEPFIDLAFEIIKDILPVLTPLFAGLKDIFIQLQPVAEQLAENLGAQLKPILEKLPGILEELIPKFTDLAERLFPLLVEILAEIGPDLGELAVALGDLLVELTPLLVKFLEFQIFLVDKMLPIIKPLSQTIGGILVGSLRLLRDFITEYVIPAVRTVVDLLNGDWRGAMLNAATFTNNLRDNAGKAFESLRTRGATAVAGLSSDVTRRAGEMAAGFGRGVSKLVQDAIGRISNLPGQIISALGNLDNLLYSAGVRVIAGFIAGINSMISQLKSTLGRITDMIPNDKGPPEKDAKLLTPAGRLVMQGFIAGIEDGGIQLRARLGQITRDLPGYLNGGVAGALNLPQPGQVTAAYAGAPGAGGTTNNFYLSNSDATPDGILRALSWRGLVGGTSG